MTRAHKKRLAIIGAGSSGLVTLKYALDLLPDWEVTCFEKGNDVRGSCSHIKDLIPPPPSLLLSSRDIQNFQQFAKALKNRQKTSLWTESMVTIWRNSPKISALRLTFAFTYQSKDL